MAMSNLPNGEEITVPHDCGVAVVWALFFAHAREGMGFACTREEGGYVFRSLYAPLYGLGEVFLSEVSGDLAVREAEQAFPCLVEMKAAVLELLALNKGLAPYAVGRMAARDVRWKN